MPVYKAKVILRSEAKGVTSSILDNFRQQTSSGCYESEYEQFDAYNRQEVVDVIIDKHESQLEGGYTSATVIFTDDSPLI